MKQLCQLLISEKKGKAMYYKLPLLFYYLNAHGSTYTFEAQSVIGSYTIFQDKDSGLCKVCIRQRVSGKSTYEDRTYEHLYSHEAFLLCDRIWQNSEIPNMIKV